MSELLGEAVKMLKEYVEWAKAPEELATMVHQFGDPSERVAYKGLARYINNASILDKPDGVVVLTNCRFLFLTKKKPVPFLSGTTHLNIPLNSIWNIESVKYRLGSAYKFIHADTEYLFLPKNLNTFAGKATADEIASVISRTRAALK